MMWQSLNPICYVCLIRLKVTYSCAGGTPRAKALIVVALKDWPDTQASKRDGPW